MANTLSAFAIDREGENYIFRLETEEGVTTEINASFAQLDLIAEAIDRVLDDDEEAALGVEPA